MARGPAALLMLSCPYIRSGLANARGAPGCTHALPTDSGPRWHQTALTCLRGSPVTHRSCWSDTCRGGPRWCPRPDSNLRHTV
jgi:hypothetical protein